MNISARFLDKLFNENLGKVGYLRLVKNNAIESFVGCRRYFYCIKIAGVDNA